MSIPMRTVVGFGDSITLAAEQPAEKKWLAIVTRELNDRGNEVRWSSINAGVGGNTTREGLARFEPDVLSHRPQMVLVEFGGNDATFDPARHVPLGEFTENLERILAGLTKISAQTMILTFTPIIDDWHCFGKNAYYEPWGGPDRCVEEYRQASRDFARKHRLILADVDAAFRAAFEKEDPESLILPDGVHLTEAGNRLVAKTVTAAMTA